MHILSFADRLIYEGKGRYLRVDNQSDFPEHFWYLIHIKSGCQKLIKESIHIRGIEMAQGQEAWAVVGQVHLCKAGCSHNFGIIFVTWYQGVTHKCRASDKRVANANCNEPCGTRCYFFSTFWYFLLRLVVEQVHLCRTGGDWCVGGWGGCIGACAQCAAPKLVGGGWQS